MHSKNSPLLALRRITLVVFTCLLGALAMPEQAFSQNQPNILWITSEDNGVKWVGCYGGTNANTPAIDQLATEGFRYTNCFDNAAVCAPTRSVWITGMYGISNGTQPMRSRNLIPHDTIKYYPDLLKQAGYHTSNPSKTDYNIGGREDKECWDYSGGKEQYGW
ncbi:MAG: sulfatase-like hydrolase/transferase, partial [Verrucomicrobiia bacterium]